jgi:hypothetical protein
MKQAGKIILFGFLTWLSTFIGAMLIFKLHESDRIFFETLISIILTSVIIFYTTLYFKEVQRNFLNEGIKIGIIWMLINLMIDIPMFSFGPMARPLWDYFKDVGFMYISIPIITISVGNLLNKKINS